MIFITGIYKITNNINGKIYIGQSIDIETRWYHHKKSAFSPDYKGYNKYLYKAFRKYGIDNFMFEIIEKCEQYQLNDREIFWISHYDSANTKKGYNITLGGDGCIKVDRNNVYKLWEDGYPISEIAEKLNATTMTIGTILKDCPTYSYKKAMQRAQGVPVAQYDLYGNLIATYGSIVEAGEATKIKPSRIASVCKEGKRITTGGFQWRYLCDTPPSKQYISVNHKKMVEQYNKNEVLMAVFDSIKQASAKTGINHSGISNCCNNKQKTAGGFIWRFKEIKYD